MIKLNGVAMKKVAPPAPNQPVERRRCRPKVIGPYTSAKDAPVPDLAYDAAPMRIPQVLKALGVSKRTLYRRIDAGRFPPPDGHTGTTGKLPYWRAATVRPFLPSSVLNTDG